MVSHRGQLFFVVSRLDRRGQSFICGQSTFFLVVVVSRRGRRGQFLWLVVLHGQSVVLIVVVSRRGQSFFVVSRSSWMVFIFYGGYAHVFTETYGWGKPRSMSGQMYGGG